MGAGRLEIDENRRRLRNLVQAVERQRDAGAPGDGGQVNDRVRRAADGEEHAQGVLDRLSRDDFLRRAARSDERHRRHAGGLAGT